MKDDFFNSNRREFLRKSAIILAGAGIPLYLQKNIFKNLGTLLMPSALAAGGNPIFWVIEIPVRATYTFGNWFPAPGLLNSPFFWENGIVGFSGDKNAINRSGRMNVAAEAAPLAAHIDNTAIFECAAPMEGDHRPLWSFRTGVDTIFLGRDDLARNPATQTLPATLAVLFNHAVGQLRSPRPAMNSGVRLGFTSDFRVTDVNNTLRPLTTINSFDEIRGYLNVEIPVGSGGTTGGGTTSGTTSGTTDGGSTGTTDGGTTGTTDGGTTGGTDGGTTGGTTGEESLIRRTDLQMTVEAIRRINKLQESQFLSLRYDRMAETRSIADDGLAYLGSLVSPASATRTNSVSTQALRNSPEELTELWNAFQAGVPVGDEPCDLGQALMTAFVGFRENVFPSASLGVFMNHVHLVPEWGTGDVGTLDSLAKIRAQDLQLTSRLGTFIDKLKGTASPFGGGTMFDHTLIVLSTESCRPIGYQDVDGRRNWGHGERWGGVLIGGNVRGGYYGDLEFTRPDSGEKGFGGPGRQALGFDPNTGAVGGPRPTAAAIYRTINEMAGIPDGEIQAQMARGYSGSPYSMNILKG